MADETRLDHLIGLLYDAAAAPERWPAALAAVGDALGGCAFIMSVLPSQGDPRFVTGARVDPRQIAVIAERYATPETNPLVAAMPRLAIAVPVAREAIHADAEYLRSDLYNEVFRPQGLMHAAVACLLRTPDCIAPLGVLRQAGSDRPDRRDLGLLARLLPHMQRSVQLYLRVASLDARRSATEDALDHLPFGVILVDARGRVLHLNRSAEAIVAAADGLAVSGGALGAATASETAALRRLVGEAAATGTGAGASAGGAMTLSRPSASRPLSVLVAPLRGQEMLLAHRRPAALVFVTDPERAAAVPGRRLIELFGLTPAEARLATALLAGKRLEQIAAERGLRLPTVRNQMRAVLAKTGTGRQAELVRILAGLPAGPAAR